MMNYQHAIHFLDSLVNYEKKPATGYRRSFKLDRFRKFLAFIGNPQENLNVIHVAGTKGKGSTCAFIASILQEAGFRVGLYTSPHLCDVRERIRVVEKKQKCSGDFCGMISCGKFANLVAALKPKITEFNRKFYHSYKDDSKKTFFNADSRRLHADKRRYLRESALDLRESALSKSFSGCLTYFEVLTALAFVYFEKNKVDFAVLETGLGGRLDATNVCASLVSVITAISLDHTQILGNTIEKIAFEKACIIKKENRALRTGKRIVIVGQQEASALRVIQARAKKMGAIVLRPGKDFRFTFTKKGIFHYRGPQFSFNNLRSALRGRHQIENASVAIATVEALAESGVSIKKRAIASGIRQCAWPARCEIISEKPFILIDGAHNPQSMKVLSATLRQNFGGKRIILIFGIAYDKEVKATCQEAARISSEIILTRINTARSSEPTDLKRYFPKHRPLVTNSLKEAMSVAVLTSDKTSLIVITGSLYLCGETRSLLKKS